MQLSLLVRTAFLHVRYWASLRFVGSPLQDLFHANFQVNLVVCEAVGCMSHDAMHQINEKMTLRDTV